MERTDKWYFDNDPDRQYEERDFLCRLDFMFQGQEKSLGKGIRDKYRASPTRIINQSIDIAVSTRTSSCLEGCENYSYHHKRYWRSTYDSDMLKLMNLTGHNKDIPDNFFGVYYLRRTKA